MYLISGPLVKVMHSAIALTVESPERPKIGVAIPHGQYVLTWLLEGMKHRCCKVRCLPAQPMTYKHQDWRTSRRLQTECTLYHIRRVTLMIYHIIEARHGALKCVANELGGVYRKLNHTVLRQKWA